ncbi:pentapeptide repeat-containing protein [Clostridium nigeriense]|uniref:pentapeptide repeat-containing protein n=1 Tax=Clostridium nigeriense TaxID=1805470 RepID=UPI0008321E16|nr:pentapeptide repeat-containing protein [Clostridium nigeriense]
MAKTQTTKGNFNYDNIEKKDKNFMYQNLERSNCYNCNFSGSNFDYVNFRGAHFKSSSFLKCSFKFTEFIGSNFKKSNFKNANFENTIFDSVRLDNVDFKDAKFKNTIFVSTDISKAKNININDPEIRIYDEMPKIEISNELKDATLKALNNKYVKSSRVLDTKEGNINSLSLMILLENFDEETLIKGLNLISTDLDRDFYTLSYLIKFIKNISI